MRNDFQDRLNDCLEALSRGERTLEECLAMYPREAERLEPLLRTALRLREKMSVEPRAEFLQGARGRLLDAAGQSIGDAIAAGPRLSFVQSARRRFLAAAQMMMGRRERRAPGLSWTSPYLRPLAASLAMLVLMFFGVGAFAVTTAGDALPGDWRYPVKRATEDVRLALAFDDDAKRDVKIDLAHERLSEIQELAEKGRPIGGDVLEDLKGETDSLVSSLDAKEVAPVTVREIAVLAKEQQLVLEQVRPLVEPSAQEEFVAAQEVSKTAYVRAEQEYALSLFNRRGEEEDEVAASMRENTPEAGFVLTEPEALPSEEAEEEEATAAATPNADGPPMAVIERELPDEGETEPLLVWDRVTIGRFSVELPSEVSGWRLIGFHFGENDVALAPTMLRITDPAGSAVIAINPRNGDTYWYQYKGGLFQEFIVRLSVGDTVWQADQAALEGFDAQYAWIVQRILDTIYFEPLPPPTPVPTQMPFPPTPTPVPDTTVDSATPTVSP